MELESRIKLSEEILQQFGVVKICQLTTDLKYSIGFSADGELVAICDHHNLITYDCSSLERVSQVLMRKYHPELVCFTQLKDQLLHSSTREGYAIRCLDLSRHQHTVIFSGHTKRVRSLCFQPGSQHQFLSAGRDNRVYMWDVRSCESINLLDYLHRPLVAYDPGGLVFAASDGTDRIEIHDVRKLSSRPCHRFGYNLNKGAKWTQLQFAPDGKTLMVSTDSAGCFSVDAFSGAFHQAYKGNENVQRLPLQSCYTPDSRYVLAGADNGYIHVWSADTGESVALLHSNGQQPEAEAEPVRCLQFSPKQMMLVSCNSESLFWMHKPNEKKEQQVEKKLRLKSVVTKIIPIIDLTATDESDEEQQQQHVNILPAPSNSWPWPKPFPHMPPQAALQIRRMPWFVRRRDADDSLEEGELNDDD